MGQTDMRAALEAQKTLRLMDSSLKNLKDALAETHQTLLAAQKLAKHRRKEVRELAPSNSSVIGNSENHTHNVRPGEEEVPKPRIRPMSTPTELSPQTSFSTQSSPEC